MDLIYDIVIVGGSFGGVAAALRAGAMGANVCLIEASDWLGGQYTAQGVTRPDENRFTQTTGSTQSYRAFQHDVRAYYRNNFNLSAKGASQPAFNPSGGYPGFGMEPRVGHNILQQQLLSSPNIHLRLNTTVTQVEMSADPNTIVSLTAVTAGVSARYIAPWYLDATDLGDLLPLCGVEGLDWTLGAEGKDETGEPHAPDAPRRDWIQPITFPFALERRPAGENHTIPKPDEYEHFRDVQGYSIKDGCIGALFYHGPSARGDCTDSQGRKYVDDMWSYRQFIDASNFNDPHFPHDLTMMNTDSNDFKEGGTLPSDSPEQDQEVMRRARLASLGYLYWLQTECPRDENPNQHGYPELKPRGDLFGTDDGLSAQPYIRESRRIKALTTILEQDISAEVNPGPRAKLFPDSCGIGLYGLDIHKLKAVGMPQLFVDALPFQIPASALVPVRLTNLLAACKNLGVTHLTNGAYRLHPVEWNIGESAGALAAFCVQANKSAKEVAQTPELLKAYQHALLEQGIPLFWWTDIELSDPIFAAAHLLGVAGILSGDEKMHFLPNDLLDASEKQFIEEAVGRPLNWPAATLTRRQAAPWLVQELGL
jgi:hypothetical protein